MSWSDLERLGGFGATEYWSKLTIGGLYLYATPAVDKVLGLDHEGMSEFGSYFWRRRGMGADDGTNRTAGKTVAQLSPGGDATAVLEALQQASRGVATTVRHQMLAKSGTVDVVTREYSLVSFEVSRADSLARPQTSTQPGARPTFLLRRCFPAQELTLLPSCSCLVLSFADS